MKLKLMRPSHTSLPVRLARRANVITRNGHGRPIGTICPWPAKSTLFAPRNGYQSRYSKAVVSQVRDQSTAIRSPLFTNSAGDTIYALSTAPGRAGIAIIRISGPLCLSIYSRLCSNPKSDQSDVPLKPRFAHLRTLRHPTSQHVLDSDAVVLYFKCPLSVTGEDVLELHVHGGSATVKAVLEAIPLCASEEDHIRYAQPGEFTKRAFQNNRLDLAQVEALSDVLSAETEQQRRAAVRGHSGRLGREYETWRYQLLQARGELEALIDFSEDQHFDESPAELLRNVSVQVEKMLLSIERHQAAGKHGELLRKGIRISILGPPNVGKSSLLNLIVGREASIVSSEAGTTRDIVEVSVDIGGYLCTFADTAGLRSEPVSASNDVSSSPQTPVIDEVEQEGIRRARAKAEASDFIIVMASVEPSPGPEQWMMQYDEEAIRIACKNPTPWIFVLNKADSIPQDTLNEFLDTVQEKLFNLFLDGSENLLAQSPPTITISCNAAKKEQTTNDPGKIKVYMDNLVQTPDDPGNIKRLMDNLAKSFERMTDVPPDMQDLVGVTERQRQLLSACRQHLSDFLAEAKTSGERTDAECDIVVAAEHLRSAANCLSRITGRGEAGDVEEVLGVVFEKFCVGK